MPSTRRFLRVPAASFAVLPLVLAACSGGKLSPEKAKAAVVVEAGGAKLTGATLASWLSQAPTPPNELAAALLVSTWLDQTLLDQSVRKGLVLDDSATIDAAITPDAVRGMLLDFWEKRAKARPGITDAQADSLADVDRVRVFQQLFISLPKELDSAAAAPIVARIKAASVRAHADGANFTTLIHEFTTDSAVLANDGFMPALTRADLPKPVADAIWALRPGEVSGILGSSGGGHLFRRASRAESRAALKRWLAPQVALRAEQRFTDSISTALGLTYSPDAVVRLRAMAPEPLVLAPGPALATWKGGELSAAKVRSWIAMLGPNERVLLSSTSDSAATRFLRELAQREILLSFSSPGRPAPNAEARAALSPQYKLALDSAKIRLREVAGASPEAEAGSLFIAAILSQRVFYRPLPGNLAGILRARLPATVNKPALDGIIAAANAAWREQHANDSTAGKAPVPRVPTPLDGAAPQSAPAIVPGVVPPKP
ncbi:MAG: peptidylprolyl isomerase [Gemmatimonadales bacterium]